MPKAIDLSGNRYGRLMVIKKLGLVKNKRIYECKCDCGNIKNISHSDLQSGRTKSCGCYRKEKMTEKNKTHGLSVENGEITRLFRIWSGVKTRVLNKKSPVYKDYGGRGISIYESWMNYENFYKWAMDNGYGEKLTLDRIDVNGNYEPNNCRWVNMKTQANNRRTNINITLGHTTKTLTQWCEIFELNYKTVQDRLKRNWNITRALTTPVTKEVVSCHR